MNRSPRDLQTDSPTVLWWSHSGRDYSRDRIVRNAFTDLGWNIQDFRPAFSPAGHLEARLRRIQRPDLVWVPCFRQRDVVAAQKWAKRNNVPLIFDPLISAWDKQVFERRKFDENSRPAKRLLSHESALFRHSDLVIADTEAHAEFFSRSHGIQARNIAVIPVSAEESLFSEQPVTAATGRRKILFYGSFIGLQGPQYIAEAAVHVTNAEWTFVGTGPLLDDCKRIANGAAHVTFLPRVPYDELPVRIREADILMGVFGDSPKAGRVIPNKVYQALACGRPVVTRRSDAYPGVIREGSAMQTGITWTASGNASDIVVAINKLLSADRDELLIQGKSANATYAKWFSNKTVKSQLNSAVLQLIRQESQSLKTA